MKIHHLPHHFLPMTNLTCHFLAPFGGSALLYINITMAELSGHLMLGRKIYDFVLLELTTCLRCNPLLFYTNLKFLVTLSIFFSANHIYVYYVTYHNFGIRNNKFKTVIKNYFELSKENVGAVIDKSFYRIKYLGQHKLKKCNQES